jgi:ABC-type transport system involved in multi-copper enzyme maturation permease subunit
MFAKEMVEISRRTRYYFNRVLYGAVLLIVLLLVWEECHWLLRATGSQLLRNLPRVAASMFSGISGVQYAAVFLFVPVFICGLIASEREERTLELLLTTQLLDREIVLGKLGSRLAVIGLLFFSAVPFMSLVSLFGGVDPAAIWRVFGATLLAIVYAGAHAIYFSAVSRTSTGALVRTYWWMGLWMLALPAAVVALLAATTPGPTFFWLSMGCLIGLLFTNPGGPFVVAVVDDAHRSTASYLGEWYFPFTFTIPLAWSLFLIWRAVLRLRDPQPVLSVRLAGAIPPLRWARQGFAQVRAKWSTVVQRRPAQDAYADGRGTPSAAVACSTESGLADGPGPTPVFAGNPLAERSRIARVYDRDGHIGRIQWGGWLVAAGAVALGFAADPHDMDDEELAMVFLTPTWIVGGLLTVVLAATSLVGDRRRGLLELVLTTPLAPHEIIDGTLIAVWLHLRRWYWLPWVLGGLFVLTGASPVVGVLASLITGTLFLALVAQLGVACSLTARTAAGALVPTIVFPVLMNVGTLILVAVFEEGSGPVLWIGAGLAIVLARQWALRSTSTVAMACYLIALHLALAALTTFWTYNGRDDEYPIAAMLPGFIMLTTLDDHRWFDSHVPAGVLLPAYWTALVVNFLWVRHWLIVNLDRLIDRPRRVAADLAGPSPAVRRDAIADRPAPSGSSGDGHRRRG